MKQLIYWIPRIIPALIMLQTLFFKFTAHPQSVRLFTELDMEPAGRIGTGVMELLASILILIPRFSHWGAIVGAGLMAGAIFFHLTQLGIVFDGDAWLFIYAVITLICCLWIIWQNRSQIPVLNKIVN